MIGEGCGFSPRGTQRARRDERRNVHIKLHIHSFVCFALFVVNSQNAFFNHEGHEDHEGEAGNQGIKGRNRTTNINRLSDHLIG
jgi:hypothetical protein